MITQADIGITASGKPVSLLLRYANRHGLVTGATGTGKSVTLQRLAEQFSEAGIPVFAADVKGDLSGIAADGNPSGDAAKRAADLGISHQARRYPVALWDIFSQHGIPIRTSVQEMGPQLLSSMLGLNPTQEGAMAICFRKAEDEKAWLLTLDDLRWSLNDMLENREDVCRQYGNITASSISAIQRNLLALESQGGDKLFGEPPFDILDFMRVEDGHGVINLLHADQLMEAPKLYATFLLWLLTDLFRRLPEAGDLDKPKLVFFFDEAHLLFRDAPKPLLEQIERLVRLVRSKGIGVFFVTQSPTDIPDAVLEQLGNRIQHALRAYTTKSMRKIRAAADALRPNPNVNAREEITALGIGEALVSVMEADNVPGMVEKVKIIPPSGQIGPISDLERSVIIEQSPMRLKYAAEDVSDQEKSFAFTNRMRGKRGMDQLTKPDAFWQEGDSLKYVPYHIGVTPIHTGRVIFSKVASLVLWGVVAFAGFKVVLATI